MKLGLLMACALVLPAQAAPDLPALNRELQACSLTLHVLASGAPPAADKNSDFLRRMGLPPTPRRITEPVAARGMGLLWHDDRHVLSLSHLLQDDAAQALAVQTADGERVAAESLGHDALSGAWLLRLARPLGRQPCRYGTAQGLQMGQELYGIGNLTLLQRSLQRGMVSGLAREPEGVDLGEPLIQTDMRTGRGMAGGPLFDAQGRVVGLHDLMVVDRGQDMAALARPIDELLLAAEALRSGKPRTPSSIGATLGDPHDDSLDADVERDAGPNARWQAWLRAEPGVPLRSVRPGSPAERAGLRAGDRLLRLQGEPLRGAGDLRRRVARLPAGVPAVVSV